MLDLTRHFSRFRGADPGRINLAAHSHHDWPDVTFDAQMRAFDDAARLAGAKWGLVFGEIMPAVAAGVAKRLSLPNPGTITFAPNTHDFLRRILSALPDRPLTVLASDAEFHTFRRQIARLVEDGRIRLETVPAEPFATFPERFRAAALAPRDLVFVSQVFFTSGATAGDLDALAQAAHPDALLVVDGYHGFMARPTDLSRAAGRLFYTAGGYKYAMAGENVCFLHAPAGAAPRPRDTGWFADFGALRAPPGRTVGYAQDGARFLGATFDPVGLYRQRAVFDWLDREGLDTDAIHAHARDLMAHFLERIEALRLPDLTRAALITPFGEGAAHGNFLTFRTPNAGAIEQALARAGVHTDHRADRMRFGFGLALTRADIDRAAVRIAAALT